MEQTSAASQSTEQQPPPSSSPAPPQPSPSSTTLLPPPSSSLLPVPPPSSSSSPLQSSPNPNPNPNPNPSNSQTRPPFNRPWSQPPFSSSSPSSSSVSTTPGQRSGGMAIGVPAHPGPPPPPPASFSSLSSPSFGQQYGGLARNSTNVPDSVGSPTTSQVRQPVQGIQGMGTMGSFGSGTQIRPGGIAAHHQRPVQSSPRPQSTPNNQSPATQNFPGHGMLRVSSVGTPGSPSPSTSQSLQAHNQPWLSSGSQGKPPLPSPPFRPQMNSLSLQQRSHIPQQHHHPMSTASQQPQASSSHQQQQQPSSSHPPQEHLGQQFPPTRVPQSITHQLQMAARGSVLGNQKPSSLTAVLPSTVQSGPPNKTTVTAETSEPCNRILSKRSIQELVAQIDPSERLDPEVEDILLDIADEFVESITTFGCSLAKHRKSTTLEAKDILLHLERNWNMTLPGFGGDEIKIYRKPFTSEIHKERLASIKKSIASADTTNPRASTGQAAGNAKGHPAKAPMNVLGSPNPKIREAA